MFKIAASILNADFSRLGEEVKAAEKAGVEMIHVDVMDGCFVPNISLGVPVVESLRKVTKLPLDVHLMILDPARYLKQFSDAGADYITIHAEASAKLEEDLKAIKMLGKKAGVSINPKTPLSKIIGVLDKTDLILVMGVEPGFGGQKFNEEVLAKISELRKTIDKQNLKAEIEVDGGVNAKTAKSIADAGADILVIGSAIYRHPSGVKHAVEELRKSI
ncbi:MAG: ribulose-phosphate 3-epimerase [Candidatus Altiarchaeota archaeon]|nr:ribulose-phosphate 3-epimerase [Candidatus Altiarchaeota archaeon]